MRPLCRTPSRWNSRKSPLVWEETFHQKVSAPVPSCVVPAWPNHRPFPPWTQARLLVSSAAGRGTPKTAVTAALALRVMFAGFALPLRAPLQPMNEEPAAGVAVSVTTLPLKNFVRSGDLDTEPPFAVVVSEYF